MIKKRIRIQTVFDCVKAFSETDFTEDLKKFDVPTLILHGDDDQIVPIGAAALSMVDAGKRRAGQSVSGAATRNVLDLKDQINADLVTFLKEASQIAA